MNRTARTGLGFVLLCSALSVKQLACGSSDSVPLGVAGTGGAGASSGGTGGTAGITPTGCKSANEVEGFFAAPTGSPNGEGTQASPWDLKTALAQPAPLVPGSKLWLRGGTYAGSFTSTLQGTAEQPIVVRSYPGELATIDGAGSTDATFTFRGSHTWLWGIEITNSGGNHSYGDRPNGVNINGKFLKLINSYIHDGGGNFMYGPLASPEADGEGLELYGNLFYLQGVNPKDAQDRAHGHAIYSQNFQGKKVLRENLVFNGFSWGVHCYAENPQKYLIDGFEFVGNVTFNTNAAQNGPIVSGNDFLVGGDQGVYAANILVRENYSWAHGPSYSVKFGYGTTQNKNLDVRDNHFAGGFQLGLWDSVQLVGNTFYGKTNGFDPATYPDNQYVATPSGVEVFVRPNQYEPGRAHVIVYNFDGAETAAADLSTVLAKGDSYAIRNAQNPLGPSVLEGIYQGGSVTLPLQGLVPQQPVGQPQAILPEDQTGDRFNVFLVLPCK